MRKYKVDYTRYDGDTWTHESSFEIVEAEDEKQAADVIKAKNCPWADYVIDLVQEIEEEAKN